MSFSAFASKVRDPGLAHRRRVSALRSCVQLYRPLGFEATLSFLEYLAGPFQRDEVALLRALGHLTASRAEWHKELRRYAAARREAKRLGHRTTVPAEENPNTGPTIWYGAPQQAALHALRYWRRSRLGALLQCDDPGAHEINTVTSECLAAGGRISEEHRQLLTAVVGRLQHSIAKGLYHDDTVAYFRTRDLLRVAALIATAANAEP